MISSTNIDGTEYRVSSEESKVHSVGRLPESLRIYISNVIQQGLGKNKSTGEIMDNIVIRGQDGQYYIKTNYDGLLMTVEPEVVDSIRNIMTGGNR